MSDRVTTIANLLACMDAVDELGSGLSDDEWATQSLCPEWTVKGVLAHLGAIEHALTGWVPETPETPPPFDKIGPFLAEAAELSGPELLDRFRAVIAARRPELEALTDDEFDRPSMTPVGPQTYGRFMAIRVFDFWVHEQDIRVPLAEPGNEGTPAAQQALDEIEGSIGYIVGKRIGLPDATSIRFRLTGPVERDICAAVVDGRAGVVSELDSPDVEIATDSLTFSLLACGRIDPQQPIDEGRITWSGAAGSEAAVLGERAARNLRFTM